MLAVCERDYVRLSRICHGQEFFPENGKGKRWERPPERRSRRSGVLGGSGRPEPGSLPPLARPRGRPQSVLGPLESQVLEAGPAVTRTVTSPVTPQKGQ